MFVKQYIQQTDSTNNFLKQLATQTTLEQGYTVYTSLQTAGRGQQGNTWDSEPDKNLLFSTLFYPEQLKALQQFRLSMAVAVQVNKVLRKYVPQTVIKWPNDIYINHQKMGGMLIENQLSGEFIKQSVIGIGININQLTFRKDIPNPTSLALQTKQHHNISSILDEILISFEELNHMTENFSELKQQYFEHLYRKEGFFLYRERKADSAPVNIDTHNDNTCFNAKIIDIEENGQMILERENHSRKAYYFKELQFIISQK